MGFGGEILRNRVVQCAETDDKRQNECMAVERKLQIAEAASGEGW